MDKIKTFLILDGAVIGAGLLFVLYHYLNRRLPTQFKDDIWEEVKSAGKDSEFVNQKGERVKIEEKIDQKLLADSPHDKTSDATKDPKGSKASGSKPADTITKPPFAFPNFKGKYHEVLGIPADAPEAIILQAHRYWIKKYHPDRVSRISPEAVNQAKVRSEQLNRARAELLRVASQRKK